MKLSQAVWHDVGRCIFMISICEHEVINNEMFYFTQWLFPSGGLKSLKKHFTINPFIVSEKWPEVRKTKVCTAGSHFSPFHRKTWTEKCLLFVEQNKEFNMKVDFDRNISFNLLKFKNFSISAVFKPHHVKFSFCKIHSFFVEDLASCILIIFLFKILYVTYLFK